MHEGAPATAGQCPWHVSVGIRRNRCPELTARQGHRGGGTIVGTRWVLTAAHCLVEISDLVAADGALELPPDVQLRVVMGTDLDAPEQEVEVTFVKIHPMYDVRTMSYDAALLRLAHDVPGGIAVAESDVRAGECGIIAGWGETHLARRIVPQLEWARVHVCPDEECVEQVSGALAGIPGLMFAAGGPQGACPEFPRAGVQDGDSGSGFVVTRSGAPRVCGIVSWSAYLPVDVAGPQVFTRTFPIAGWIARGIGQ
jgi:secreted trypsin-like serine protease